MLLTLLGLVGVAVAAVFVTLPMLRPDDGEAAPAAPVASAAVGALEREKNAALAAIKDAEFDHGVGKLSDDDYARLRGELEEQALRAMASLDAQQAAEAPAAAHGGPNTAAPVTPSPPAGLAALAAPAATRVGRPRPADEAHGAAFCPSCGSAFAAAQRFCARCGAARPGLGDRPARKRA
jgi:hypothetical protein